jgi:hypothetical protein
MSGARPSSTLSWSAPDGTQQPGFPRSGAFPAWRLDGHELAWAEVSAQSRICRFSLLLNALRQTPCPLSQSFLPIPAVAASLWDPVVAPDGARMAFLRVGLHGERVDVWVQAINDPQGTTALNLSGGLPNVLYAITPAWSPNGRYLAFAAGNPLGFSIYLHDFQTSTTTPVPGMAGTWAMPFWSSDSGALAAIPLIDAAPAQYTLGTANAVPFAPPAGSVWGQVFVPTPGGGGEIYAWLTDYNPASRDFAIQSPNVSAGTRGVALRAECPECGLLLHGVTLSGAWSMDDVRDIYAGVVYTGEALALQFGGRGYEAFQRILVQGVPSIVFQRSTAAGVACNANGFPVITCSAGSQPSQYTVVHELGHVFTQRTGGTQTGNTFYGWILNGVFDRNGGVVVGATSRTNPTTRNTGLDWQRGQRGWGSHAAPQTALIPCDFQQNPFEVFDFDVTATPGQPQPQVIEVDEAAADMFLNWIYSRLTSGESAGFKNLSYLGLPRQCNLIAPFDGSLPGDARFQAMTERIMPVLATRFPTPTATPTLTP